MLVAHRWSIAMTALLAASVVACASRPVSREDETTSDLRNIARAYEVVINQHRHPPRDVEELKRVLADLHEANLNPPADEVLTSSRDGQPYVIILGADLGASAAKDVLAYEKKGKEGKRYVLYLSRDIMQLTDAEFARATFAMGHKPAGG
jgi:hypothetical protein